MGWRASCAALVASLAFLTSLAAEDRWEIRYFYDKNDSSLSFTDLHFSSAKHGVALGSLSERNRQRSVVLLTFDGGRTWALIPLKDPALSLFFLNDQTGWLVGQKNRLWKTPDGGRTWAAATSPQNMHAQALRVFFLDESHGWLLCTQKQVFSTEDGGRSWKPLPASRKPGLPDANASYTWAVFSSGVGWLTAWSRPPEPKSEIPEWMRPELRPLSSHRTSGVLLLSEDAGKTWEPSVLPDFGEIVRVRLSASGDPLMLLQHPDSLSVPSEIVAFDRKTRAATPVYRDKNRWLTDLIFSGANMVFATAIDQEGRTPFPTIPSRLKILRSTDLEHWTEMKVDYRAEAVNAMLAAPDAEHAWVATDTGMILTLMTDGS